VSNHIPPVDKVTSAAKCFPSHATVLLESGAVKRMDEVAIGNRVLVDVNRYSEVFVFTHKAPEAVSDFVRLESCCGEVVQASRDRSAPTAVWLRKARCASATPPPRRLVRPSVSCPCRASRARGLFDPQTLDGDIVVDGLLASTYTTTVEPVLAHAALAPTRLFYQVFGVATSVDSQGRTFSGVSSSEAILSCSY
jgi:Hint module